LICARLQGVTQVAEAPLRSWAGRAHFAQPLEFEFELLVEEPPPPTFWPTLYFQVGVDACQTHLHAQSTELFPVLSPSY